MTDETANPEELLVSKLDPNTFVGFATEEDFPDEDCACCAMICEEIRNGAKWELHVWNLDDFDEDDLFED